MLSYEEWLKEQGLSGSAVGLMPAAVQHIFQVQYNKYKEAQPKFGDIYDQYKSGDISASDMQGILANQGIEVTPEQTQWVNNELANQRTEEDREYNTEMRDTSLTSAASQLEQIGLSPSNVISTGGAGIGNSQPSYVSNENPAMQKAMADFNKKASMTRTILGLVGGLGAAGIYGSTRLMAQKAAKITADATANSGIHAIRTGKYKADISQRKWDKILAGLNAL